MSKSLEAELSPDDLMTRGHDRMVVRVNAIRYQGEDLNEYELVDPEGKRLPTFSPGSHVDIYFRDGRVRQYSLCSDPEKLDSYRIVIQRDAAGRGGSKDFFVKVHVGRLLVISKPRNNFPLVPAEKYVLIAGGIGITPIMSMARELARAGKTYQLHYATRSKNRTALLRELEQVCPSGSLHVYHDGGDPRNGLDLAAVLGSRDADTHLFYCGPPGLMNAIANQTAEWPQAYVHSEHFGVPPPSPEASPASQPTKEFEVLIASSGQHLKVPENKTILEVLRSHGWDVPSSCEAGVCGTCRVRFLDGIPDHRDLILGDSEKSTELLVCCSRSLTPRLVLDL